MKKSDIILTEAVPLNAISPFPFMGMKLMDLQIPKCANDFNHVGNEI